MLYQLTTEEREVLEILRNDLNKLSKQFLYTFLSALQLLKKNLSSTLVGLSDFKWSNIKKNGFINVLTKRAHRFFSIEEEKQNTQPKYEQKKIKLKRRLKRLVKMILLPIYLVLICLAHVAQNKKKMKKNVINRYTP